MVHNATPDPLVPEGKLTLYPSSPTTPRLSTPSASRSSELPLLNMATLTTGSCHTRGLTR